MTKLESIFYVFKCLTFGETVTIIMVLLAYLYTVPECWTITPLTICPYYGVRMFGESCIYLWTGLASIFPILGVFPSDEVSL